MITFNQEAFVAEAIDSVLMQRCDFAFELVVGEDCSTDATRKIVEEYAQLRPDIVKLCTSETNVGAQRNLARVFAACSGQYVAILDGDDYWTSPDKLQHQVDYLDAHPDCALCFHNVQFDDGGTLSPPYLTSQPERSGLRDLLCGDNYIASCTAMYRWGLVETLPPWWNDLWIADLPLHVLHAQQGWIGYLDEVMAAYRVHAGGLWTGKQPIDRSDGVIRTFELLDQHLGHEFRSLIRKRIFAMKYAVAGVLLESGHRDLAGPRVWWCVSHLRWRGQVSLARVVVLATLQVAPWLVPLSVRAKRILRRLVR